MEEINLLKMIPEYGGLGAGLAVALALFYKIWQVLKLDHRVEELSNTERIFRNEMRGDLKDMREELKILHEEHEKCEEEKRKTLIVMHEINLELTTLKNTIKQCSQNNSTCDFLMDPSNAL